MHNEGKGEFQLTIDPGEETLTVTGPFPDSPLHRVPNPLLDAEIRGGVSALREISSTKIPVDQNHRIEDLDQLALELSSKLTPYLLSDVARRQIALRLNKVHLGRLPLYIRLEERRSEDPADLERRHRVLALPWELVAPEPWEMPVRESRMELVREVVVEGAPELMESTRPLVVGIVVAAPENQPALALEREEIRLHHALSRGDLEHQAIFTNLGALDDLIDLVEREPISVILFSGHGLPGRLLFEDRLGFEDRVETTEVVRRLNSVLLAPGRGGRAGHFPNIFFFSSCASATPEHGPPTAASLHRAGFTHVIGYFGAVRDSASSQAEQTYFQALAKGEQVLQAAHLARASLIDPIRHEGELFRYPLAWSQLAIYHRGPDRSVAPRPTRRRGRPLPPRFRRVPDLDSEIPILKQGFVGRRALQHEILRKVEDGERLILLHGLSGIGKTALAGHMMSRRLFSNNDPGSGLVLAVAKGSGNEDPIDALARSVSEHCSRFGIEQIRRSSTSALNQGPTARFFEALESVWRAFPNLVMYVDGLDPLRAGSEGWVAEAEPWWRGMLDRSREGLLVLASLRWFGPDLPIRSHVGVPTLSEPDLLRMSSFFVELADVAFKDRRRSIQWADGHASTIDKLDQAVREERQSKGLGFETCDPFEDLIKPSFEAGVKKAREEARVEEIWARLPISARDHAKAIAKAGNWLSATAVDQLGGERDLLVRSGLLIRRLVETPSSTSRRWSESWGVPTRLLENELRSSS